MRVSKKPAHDIAVADFRLILQWPLLLDVNAENGDSDRVSERIREMAAKLTRDTENGWSPVENPSHYPPPRGEPEEKAGAAALAYAQSVYFHDFARDFLFEQADPRPEMAVFERSDVTQLRMIINKTGPTQNFAVDRVSVHLFSVGVAIFSFELRWTGFEGQDPPGLTLADCQTTIDLLRRSFAPYLTSDGSAGGVPSLVALTAGDAEKDLVCAKPQEAAIALKAVKDNAPIRDWPRCFDHWARLIQPFALTSRGGAWRDPADERIPVNSFIRLAVDVDHDPSMPINAEQAALLTIRDSDWYRLAEADSAADATAAARGDCLPYNARFMADKQTGYFYDRFFPSEGCADCATRHVFGPSHHCVVSAGWFAENHLVSHFRRHYALMGLIVRLEQAVLLSLSRRLSNATAHLNTQTKGAEDAFESAIIDIHGDFLKFCHRYRFTGVSNQIQPSEMLAMWRSSMGLDALFTDVEGELAAAFQRVTAMQQRRESEASVDLSRLAAGAALLGLILAAASGEISRIMPVQDAWFRFFGYTGAAMVSLPIATTIFSVRSRTFKTRLMWVAFAGVGLIAAVALTQVGRGG